MIDIFNIKIIIMVVNMVINIMIHKKHMISSRLNKKLCKNGLNQNIIFVSHLLQNTQNLYFNNSFRNPKNLMIWTNLTKF